MNYYLFVGDNYYPGGGTDDLVLVSTDLQKIIEAFREVCENRINFWAHICYGEKLARLTTMETSSNRGLTKLFDGHDLWKPQNSDVREQVEELNKITRHVFLGEPL